MFTMSLCGKKSTTNLFRTAVVLSPTTGLISKLDLTIEFKEGFSVENTFTCF